MLDLCQFEPGVTHKSMAYKKACTFPKSFIIDISQRPKYVSLVEREATIHICSRKKNMQGLVSLSQEFVCQVIAIITVTGLSLRLTINKWKGKTWH